MKTLTVIITLLATLCLSPCNAAAPDGKQWQGRHVAFLGDSMTDPKQPNQIYWQFLGEWLGLVPVVYGVNGNQWSNLPRQIDKLDTQPRTDAIIILAGTNDYNANVPLGEWFDYDSLGTVVNGREVTRLHRTANLDPSTFRGRINRVLGRLKESYPDAQIILLTPIHRGYATFGATNIQPEESFANALGLFIDDYVQVVKQAADVWSVTVIDTNSLCGLYPLAQSNLKCFRNGKTDRLHPNTEGHRRIAEVVAGQLLSMPAGFVR